MPDSLIKPQTLKGFRDYLPDVMIPRERLMETAREVYRSYGFSPIDTPALEYSEILLGKGGEESDKQLFRFIDQGDRDVAMRFDLTVPFARFAAEHLNEIGVPFKRYHIGTVWRAEKPQKGRYREFVQCDFDTIGTDANASDIETLFVIHDLFERLGFSAFTIRVNHRQLLNGLLEQVGLAEKSVGVLRTLDKLPKIGRDAVLKEMTEGVGASAEAAARVLDFAALTGSPDDVLRQVEALLGASDRGRDGIARLRELFSTAALAGIPAERIALDVSIARGLDYYTGTIYETFLNDLRGIGSVCSGGRYDNLAGAVHQDSAAGGRGQPRPRPVARGDGGTWTAPQGGDAGTGAGDGVRRGPHAGLHSHRPRAATGRDRHGGLPAGEEAPQATAVRGSRRDSASR